jgi:hypothetical protein
MKIKSTILVLLLAILTFGCYKEPDFVNFNYETYNRVVGPEGGIINFYANYDDDDHANLLVRLDFPQDALDSLLVF